MQQKQAKKALKRTLFPSKKNVLFISIALITCIASLTAQRVFQYQLDTGLNTQAAQLLTGHLEIASNTPLTDQQYNAIAPVLPQHNHAKRHIFATNVQYYGTSTLLVEMVAIDKNYPLIGLCSAQNKNGDTVPMSQLIHSTQNAVVVSKDILSQTDITYGSTIKVGAFTGTVIGTIKDEPDINMQTLSLGPRMYMSYSNTNKTGFSPQLSKTYSSNFYQFKQANIAEPLVPSLNAALGIISNKKTMRGAYGPSQPVLIRLPKDINETIQSGMETIRAFFSFLTLFLLILTSAGFAYITWHHIVSKQSEIQTLYYIGFSKRSLLQLFLKSAIVYALFITTIGILLGIVATVFLLPIIQQTLNLTLPFHTIDPYIILFVGLFSTANILCITSFGYWLAQKNPSNTTKTKKIALTLFWIFCMFTLLSGFLYLNHLSWLQSLILCGLTLAIIGLLGLCDRFIFPIFKRSYSKNHSHAWRLAMLYLSKPHPIRRMAFICLGCAMIGLFTIAHYTHSLKKEFQPTGNTLPNFFFTDIYTKQVPTFKKTIQHNYTISSLTKARISAINGIAVNTYAKQKKLSENTFLFREQNLSTRANPYPKEQILAGTWFSDDSTLFEASLESRFADRLKLSIGDTITFRTLGIDWTVTVTSLRRVNWGTFKPNFFIILEPGSIAALPKTWVGSINTNTEIENLQLKQQFSQHFPNGLLIDIKKTAQKVLSFLQLFTNTIQIGTIFGLIIGALLFNILTKLHLQSRTKTFSMLYWMGLSKKAIHKITLYEHMVFVTTLFLFSSIISIGSSYMIVTKWIRIPFFVNWTGWLSVGLVLYIFSIWIWITNRKEIK